MAPSVHPMATPQSGKPPLPSERSTKETTSNASSINLHEHTD